MIRPRTLILGTGITVLAVAVGLLIFGEYLLRTTATVEGETLCELDVQQCPDGSYIGRVPPSCEFAQCPLLEEGEKDLFKG